MWVQMMFSFKIESIDTNSKPPLGGREGREAAEEAWGRSTFGAEG